MKTLIIIFLFLPIFAYNQNWTRFGLFTASILTNSIGDALNDSKHKDWGHALNTMSIGLLLTTPLLIEVKRSDWVFYLGSYSLMRYGLFDITYNTAKGLDPFYQGRSGTIDYVTGQIPSWLVQGTKVISLCCAITWNFNQPKRKYCF